jgi:S1-C subfamily serine protease
LRLSPDQVRFWKNAVVHLEGVADPTVYRRRRQAFEGRDERIRRDSPPEPGESPTRKQGTGLFIVSGGRRYLLTARHVVTDEVAAIAAVRRLAKRTEAGVRNWVFPHVYRVPTLDEAHEGRARSIDLVNVGSSAGTVSGHITYSDPVIDLAVFSLDHRPKSPQREFADELEAIGHRPVDAGAIADGPTQESAEVFAIGYPDEIATYRQGDTRTSSRRGSDWASAPLFSFGHVAMVHARLEYFWADLSVYPGNSGGPVVEANRLVGLVSGQALVEDVRVPFARIIPGAEIKKLLGKQREKDERF